MLLRQNTGGQFGGAVAGEHRHNRLPPDRSMVQFGCHFMNRGTGKSATGIDSALVGMQARERREERRVDIEQAALVERHEGGRQDAHEASQ